MILTPSIHFCSICTNDGFDDIPAEFCCETCHQHLCHKDSRIHTKQFPQHLMRKLNDQIVTPLPTPSVSSHFCHLHQCPINTFCKTCRQVICSGCCVSSQHKSHDCYLLSEIDQEMRQEVKKELDKLRELKTEWELKCHTDDTSLDQEIVEIEKQRQVLKKEMDTVFDELHQSLRKRHDTMNEELDKLCQERICIISKIKEMKQQAEHSKKEFDNLDRMTTFEMIQTKTSSLEIVLKDLEKMISEFKYRSVTALYELKWTVDQQEVNELKKQIDQLGSVNPCYEISQNLSNPNEWLYDHSRIDLSNDNNVVRLVKKAENNTYPLSFNNTRMEIGIFKWKVKIEKLERIGVGWIGVGVSTEEIVSSRQFGAFVYPYESHKSYLISCNGYTWSMDLNENQKANGFKFTTGHELELEMNCNTRKLTIRKLGTNESFTFNNVVLPVYPSVALCGRDGSVTF